MAKRALVVNDCEMIRSTVAILLQRNGWEAVGASDGAEALRIASTWHFDLVITNPEPTKVPGTQLVRILKWQAASPRVLLLEEQGTCGSSEAENLADGFIFKELGIEKQLCASLAQLFGVQQSLACSPAISPAEAVWDY